MNEVWRRVHFNLSTCFARRCFGRWTRILVLLALYGLGQSVVASAQSWVNLGPGADYAKIIKVDPSTPSTLYAGLVWEYGDYPVGGVFKSTNSGQSWSNASTGLPTNLDIYALAIDPQTPTILYTGGLYGGVYKSVNGGASWTATMSSQNNSVQALAIDPKTPTTIYAGFSNTGVYKSVDGAATWNLINTGLPGAPIVNALAIVPQTPTTIYAGLTGNGVYKSIDGGNSWSAVGTGLLSGGTVRALAINPVTPTTVYAATDVVFGNTSGQVFVSVDGGSTWNSASSGLPVDAYGLHDVEIDPVTPSTLYVAVFGGGVYKSTDSGNTWTAMNTGLTDVFDHNVAIALTSPTTVYVASCNKAVFMFASGTTQKVPGMPTNVTGTAGNGQVAVSWSAPASNGGSAITGYQVQLATVVGGPYSNAAGCPMNSTTTSCTATGLSNGTTYFFQVAAINGVGTGPYSAPSSGVTPAGGADLTPNKVLNPGFENGLSPWTTYGAAGLVNSPVASGQYAAQVQANSGVFQQVNDLLPNTTYVLTAQARVEVAGTTVWVGVKNHGGPEQYQEIVSTGYTLANVTFTTGPSSTGALIYLWLNAGVSGRAWGDDYAVVPAPTGSYTLTASPSSVAPRGTITASWTAPAGQSATTDWIGLYATGSPNASPLSSASTGGATSGSLNFMAPTTSGTFELRYLNSGYTSLATSNAFTVTGSSGSSNKVLNPGFENGLSPWTTYGTAGLVNSPVASGQYAAQVQANSGLFQQINGLLPNTTYVLTAQARVEVAGTAVWVGVKNHGGPEQYQEIVSTGYTAANVAFTTGPSSTSALIYLWLNPAVSGRAWGDDYTVSEQ